MVDTTTSKLGADMTDEQLAEFGYAHSDEHDEPLFAFDRAGFIACVHAILARQTALTDELRECMYLFSAIGGISRNNLENLAFERIEAIRHILGDQEAPSLIKE